MKRIFSRISVYTALALITALPVRMALACDLVDATCQAIALAGQSSDLMKEVEAKLKTTGTTLSSVRCGGLRLGRHFVHLGGARIIPYECDIGGAKITIGGKADFFDDQGTLGAGPETAMYYSQFSPSWHWK